MQLRWVMIESPTGDVQNDEHDGVHSGKSIHAE